MSARLLSLLALALGAGLVGHTLRRRCDRALTAATLAVLLGGTFLLDLVARPVSPWPAASFLLSAAALALAAGPLDPRRGGALGLCAGGAALVHPPGAALLLLALPRTPAARAGAATALGAAALAVAAGARFGLAGFALGRPHPLATLFGSRGGLLFFTPVLWLGLLGLAARLRRQGHSAAPPALAAAVLLLLQALGPVEWPAATMAGLLPLLAPGVAHALGALRAAVRRAPAAPLWAAGIALVGWNLAFMEQYASGMIPRDFPVSFAEVDGHTAALVAGRLGAPTSWPANWVFALRHGVGPARFDLVEGKAVPRDAGGAAVVDVGLVDLDEALLLEGWSVRHPCGAGAVCRAVEGRARALLPVDGGAALLRVRAAGRGLLRVSAAGRAAPPLPLGPTLADLEFDLGRPGAGWQAVVLEASPGGEALIDRLQVAPARGARP